MLQLPTALRAACSVVLAFALSLPAWAQTNQAPQIVSQPERLATVKLGFDYAVRAQDADGDTLRYALPTAPAGATIDASSGALRWRPTSANLGVHPFVVAVEDGKSGRAEQRFDLKVVEDFCAIYPITLPKTRVDGLSPGALIDRMERGTGAGNFSWLSWSGATDAPTMARSLTPPGNSDTYVDPDDATDRLLNIGDWAQGSTGSMNSSAIRAAMDVLKTIDIILPVWDDTRGQGSRFDYHVQRFVTVRLTDYQLTGQGWLSFEYKGEATCYNRAPTALPQAVVTDEDVPVAITLTGTDPENDALTYTVLDAPKHGTLSGTVPALTYTPAPGYYGPDQFTFKVNDGQLDSAPARIDITVRLVNRAPVIVSPAVTVATEAATYRYDVNAEDPDRDVLVYAIDRSPDALTIAPASGLIEGVVDAGLVQSVRTFNAQCYVFPEDVEPEDGAGTVISRLFQGVRSAIGKGSAYAAPQTVAWHQRNVCLGCHVQNQTLLGLQGSMERASVDEQAAEYLLKEILASQQSDGSIRRSHPEFSRTQTAFALWALSYVPDRARTLVARERALRFFQARINRSGPQVYWTQDHNSGWLNSADAATALVALASDRFLRDIARLPGVSAEQIALGLQLRQDLAGSAEFFLAQSPASTDNLTLALDMLGLAQTESHLGDAALRTRVQERLRQLETTLRGRAAATGGWARFTGAADPLTSAWVGFALDTRNPPLTDPVVLDNIEFLLAKQNADGTWHTNSGLFATHLGTTGLVMAYLPIALEHLGNPDLALGHMKLEVDDDGYRLSVEATNRGLADVDVGSTVSFHAGRTASGPALGEASAGTLRSGETRWVSIALDTLPAGDVSAAIRATGIDECLDDNNTTRAGLVSVRATDPHALFDTQHYLVNLEDANSAPVITSAPVTAFEQGKPYDYQVTVADADIGDAHSYELRSAPAGLYINPFDGRFGYTLGELAAGTHSVRVRVTDLRGAFAEQTFTLVIAPNHPPRITSTPVLRVYVGQSYRYDVDATDEDGDVLRYRFDGAPLTMTVDAESGVIAWVPEARHVGDHTVAVIVEDGRGGSDRQTWTVKVETVPVNRAPTITTTAPPQVGEGAVYRYDIDATDPDGDLLQYAQQRGPQGASVVAGSGVLTWSANDARLVSGVRAANQSCRTAIVTEPFRMEQKWAWTGSPQEPRYDQVLSTALVAPLFDHNGDGSVDEDDYPSVVFLAFLNDANAAGSGIFSARLRVIDGRTGEDQWVTNSSIDLDGHGTPAIGDIDGDGIPDIVSQTADGGVAAFNRDGSVKWRVAPIAGATRWRVAHLADLTGDGSVEIVVGDAVLDARGNLLWRLTDFRGLTIGSTIVTGLVSIADLDGDGSQEIIAGASSYSATGTVRWKNAAVGDGSTAIADFDRDGKPEIVVVGSGAVSLVRGTDGSRVWGPVIVPGGGRVGPPTVGDMNGDGTPEIGVAGASSYAAISAQGQILWTASTQDNSSNVTGSTIADLDGDGRAEVLYRDERFFRIYDGSTGAVLEQVPMTSVTAVEYPVVADIDLDGEAEILVTADDLLQRLGRVGGPGVVGVRAFASASGAWTPTRSIWNQHAYHIDNINDDGSVPRRPVRSWLTHNTYRLNTFADRHPLGQADLALFDLRLDEASGSLRVLVTNRGLAPTTTATSVNLYNGDPDQGGTLLGRLAVPVLAAGEEQTLTLTAPAAGAVSTNVFARVDEAGAVAECIEDNNRTAAAYFEVRATDPAGLFDSQRFTVTVENANTAPAIVTSALPPAAVGRSYAYRVTASDPDLGDGIRFELAQAPAGLRIEPVTGALSWVPSAAQNGTHTVRVRAIDLGGLSAERSFELQVSSNQPPQITTTPGLSTPVGTDYRYDVDATDAEAEALVYSLTVAPSGMLIDGVTGVIRWTPSAAGSYEVEVRVTDARGAYTLQRYTLVVQAPANRAPTITSTPSSTASPGRAYTYLVDATDPDNDALSVLLPVKPAGMVLNEANGQITWTPTSAQVGSHPVQVQVIDGRGGTATQSFNIVVTADAVNRLPSITSTPSTTASPGRAYTYLVDATDPDNDTLSVLLPVKPAGMVLNELSGQITWTPTSEQLGTHPVQVQVTDGRGGVATQNFSIVVAQIVGNQPPSILSTPPFTAKAGREYRYPVQAEDPNGDVLNYSLIQAPPGMTIAANGTITWTPSAAGSSSVRVRVADAQAFVEQSWTITVLAADVPLNANVNITPNPVQPGGTITIQVQVEGAAGQPTVTGTIDGQPLPLDPDGTTTVTAPTTPGPHTVIVTVTDGFDTDTTTTTFNVVDPSDTVAPTVQIHSPREAATADLLVITSPQDVVASVSDDRLRRWSLQLFERGAPGSEGILLASGTTNVSNAEVGRIDPTLLMNGQYSLVLKGEDVSGNVAQDIVAVSIEGAMKLGHFSITFEDLNLPVSGIPVTVSRTYDTRTRHRNLDFGHGWSLSYQNVRVHESRRPGFGWEFKVYPSGPLGLIPNYCMESALGNVVSITLADGKVEKFRPKAVPECNQVLPLVDVSLVFVPVSGTHGQLKAIDDTSGRLMNGSIAPLDMQDEAIDPDNYLYTDKDGVEYTLDQNFGLRKIHERTGDNQITFGRDGILHSNGTSVNFVRNAAGRITKVIAPDASELGYEYDASGNLTAFVDAGGNRTTFTYQSGHYLQDIIDARGVRVSRNEYDDDGRLVAIIDADGNRIEYTRDLEGRVETVKDRNGGRTIYVYNDRGDVLAETNPEGETTHRTYDANGNELSRTDALNRTQRWTYDGLGNVLTETNGAGEKTTNVYGSFNHLLTQADNGGNVVLRNTWRNITLPGTGVEVYPGPLVTMTDASGSSTNFVYDDATGELSRMTDATGASQQFILDGRGYKVAVIDALGRRTDYVNDDLGRVLEERRVRTRADGTSETLTTRYELNPAGNVTAIEHPDGSVTRSEYDANDRVAAEVDALGRRTEYVYNDRGELASTRYPDGRTESKTYDDNGNVLTHTNTAGHTTKFVYDAANRLTDTILPDETPATDSDNPRSRNVYDAAGQLTEAIDENGNSKRYEYDAAGRTIKVSLAAVDGQPAEMVDEYDNLGRRIASTDAEGHRVAYRYDAAGRLIETMSDGASVRIEYDAAGRKTAETDAAGRVTRFSYDALGRLVSVVLPNPATGANPPLIGGVSPDNGTLTTRHVYDEVGNKISQTDAEGRVTRWEYDAMGRETARVLPEGQRETKSYDAAGELIEHTDFNGRTTRYEYDTMGRVERVDYPADVDLGFQYNAAGERIVVTDGRGTSTAEFDQHGRIVQARDADGGLIEYTYDAAGNLLSRTSPSQSLVYVYDARSRLAQVTRTLDGEMPTVTRYEYDADGNRTAMLGGDGIRTEYTYDRRHRLTQLVKKSAASAILLAMQYSVDASGMRTTVEEHDAAGLIRTVAFAYDATKRLTQEAIDHRDNAKDRTSAWTYDDVGNRLTQTVATSGTTETTSYVYDDNDRLEQEVRSGGTGAGTTTYIYDDNGNTLSKTAPSGSTSYRYDDANRLVQATTPEGVTSYVYNANGLRVRQTHTPVGGSATTTWYVQDTAFPYAQVIEQYSSVGAGPKKLAATFTFADDLISQTRYDASSSPATHFVHADGSGSTRWLTTSAGAISDTFDYDAFGNEIGRTGSTVTEHLYRGEAFDPNLGFYYLRARWMNPDNGRFTQADPFGGYSSDPMSLHKYLYAHSNPVMFIDPSGLVTLQEVQASQSIQFVLSAIRTTGSKQIRNAAFRRLGQLAQEQVGHIAREVLEEIAEEVLLDGLVSVISEGPDTVRYDKSQKRVLDFMATSGDFVADIEVKYGLPNRGSAAMKRLISQVRSMRRGPGALRVLIIMSDNVSDAGLARLKRSLRSGRAGPVEILNGAGEVTDFFRKFLLRGG